MKSDILFNTIEIGDIVRLNQPYKTDDFQNNDTFLAALNNGVIPQTMTDKLQLYQSWAGFNYGIVNNILSRKADGKPRTLSFLNNLKKQNLKILKYSIVQRLSFAEIASARRVKRDCSSGSDRSSVFDDGLAQNEVLFLMFKFLEITIYPILLRWIYK